MDPLISVIVPVYNGQDYLENCIKSIQMQTYKEKEIIIVDDGSKDQTGRICRELAGKHENVRAIFLNDRGVSVARNFGMDNAKGKYLMFADADDGLHPETMQILYDALIRTGSDVAGCGFFLWSREAEWKSGTKDAVKEIDSSNTRVFQRNELLDQIAEGKDTRCWAKLYKREVIGNHKFREGLTIGEDMIFLLDILPDVNKMVSVDFKGYGYYQNPAGAMNRKFTPAYMDQIICWELARELAVKMDAGMEAAVTEKLLMAIMLVVGKIAFLSPGEKKNQKEYIQVCRQKLRENMQIEGGWERLSKGYKVKTKIFDKIPAFYMWLYHFRKYI